jgi:outer membrane protein
MKATTLIASAIALAVASPLALAHKEGELILRAGAAMVSPQTDSDEIETAVTGPLAGTKATVNDNTQLGLTLSYMLTDHVGIELLAASPFHHRVGIKGLGALDGKLADVKQLPPTLSVQHYPMAATSAWQPYVGAGVNFTTFFDEKLTSTRKSQGFSDIELKDSWGLALQVGSDFMITDKLMLNAAVWYVDLNTKATAQHDVLGKVKVDVEIDPWVFMLGIGYKF